MDNKTTASYGTTNDPNVIYPPAYPPNSTEGNPAYSAAYPPVSAAYPPVSTAYPPMSSAYPPPAAAPPPYSTVAPEYQTTPYTAQTTNTTVVVVNDPDLSRIPNDYSPEIGFSSKSVRLGFIRRVFALLSLQLLVTIGFICLFLFVPAFEKAGKKLSIYIAAYVIFLVLYIVLVCCDGIRRSYPTNLILFALFTLSLSYLVGVISSHHDTNVVLIMMGVTAAVTISVSIFACQTKFDMTKFGGVLFVFALVVFFVLIFTPAFLLVTTAGKIVFGGVLALIFTAFMIYDVQLVMGGRKYELSEEEYVFGALILYIDIVNLFLLLLYLFGGSSN